MNSHKLTVLAIVAVIMVIWATALTKRSHGPARTNVPTHLIQGLDTQLIGTILLGKGDEVITLERQGKQFVAKDKDSYPASTQKINDLITKCLDISTTELYSSNPKNHDDLGITLEKSTNVIRFVKKDGQSLTGLVVGHTRQEGGSGTFVRRTDSNDVYITPTVPNFSTDVTSFLEQELLTIDKDNIATVRLTDPNNSSYTLVTDADDNKTILMSNLPAGKKLLPSMARSVMTALTSMRFEDVSRTADPNAVFDHTYVAKTKDATVYTFKIAVMPDTKVYVQASAEYTDKVLINTGQQDNEQELKEKENKLKTQEKALTFTAKHNGWIYLVPEWKAQYLVKYQEELLEDLPQLEDLVTEDINEPSADNEVMKAAPVDLQEAMQVGESINQ